MKEGVASRISPRTLMARMPTEVHIVFGPAILSKITKSDILSNLLLLQLTLGLEWNFKAFLITSISWHSWQKNCKYLLNVDKKITYPCLFFDISGKSKILPRFLSVKCKTRNDMVFKLESRWLLLLLRTVFYGAGFNSLVQLWWRFHAMFVVGIWSARLDSYSKSGTRPVDFFTRFVFCE